MKRQLMSVLVATAFFAFAGCKDKPREIPKITRAEAENLASEAAFATQVRDHTRAEALLVKATKLIPEESGYWLALGATRKRLGNASGARSAYKEALAAEEKAYQRDGTDTDALMQQIYALCLLGRADDARKLLDKARSQHPDNRAIKNFADSRGIDRMLADPGFKELAL